MKKLFISLLVLTTCCVTFAQSRIGTAEFQKIQREGISNELSFPEKTISAAITETLQKLGYKGKETQGFIVFKSVVLPALGSQPHDLYFSIERKSKKEKDASTVTLLISTAFDNFVTQASNPELVSNAMSYMDSLRNTVAIYDLEEQIKDQETVMEKEDKKMLTLISDGEDQEKQLKKLQDKIESNKKSIVRQQSETDVQKQILETLRAKRVQ